MKPPVIFILVVSALFSSTSFPSENLLSDSLHSVPCAEKTINHEPADEEAAVTYSEAVHKAFLDKFNDAGKYTGQACTIKLKFTRSGVLVLIKETSGDQELCARMKEIATEAKFPKPINSTVWNQTKGFIDITLSPH